jgi:hypothetical protein
MRPSKLDKVLGVVGAGLFAIAIALANTGPGTPELPSGGRLLGPGYFDTPTTSAPRAHALPAAKQKPIKAPPPSLSAGAQKADVHQNSGGVVLASASTERPASAPTVAAPSVSPNPAAPPPAVAEPVAPKPAPPKPPPPTPPKIEPKPEPEPEPPTVTPREGDPKVIVVVVVLTFHDHHGDDVGHDDGCDHSGDQNGEHSHDGYDSPEGSHHGNSESESDGNAHGPKHDRSEHDDSTKAETEHAGDNAPGQLGDGSVGSLIGAGTEE